jgi:drug/metabolite transporter (DMT)-like permease
MALGSQPLCDCPGTIDEPAAQQARPVATTVARAADASASSARLLRLVLWMTGALLSFSVAALSVRALSKTLSVFEIISIRSGGGLIILLTLIAVQPGLRHTLALRQMGLHAFRNSVQFVGQVAWMKAVTLLPLATVFALEFTMPAWVAILAVVFLGEKLSVSRVGSVILCFLGVLVIVRPGFAGFQPASLLVLGAALSFAITLVATKKLTATVSTFAILFWLNAMQFPVNLALSNLWFVVKLDAATTLPLLGIVISGLSAHYCFANAFRFGDATIVVPIDFLRVPLIAFVGASFYGEPLSGVVFAGAGLIASGVVWNLRAESRAGVPDRPAG